MVAINPYLGMVPSLDADAFDAPCSAVAERKCRELIGAGTLEEAAALWRPRPCCPSCGSPGCWQNGKTPAGHKRWLCPECGTRFSALTGTVLEYGKKELPTWERFITCMCYNAPIDLIAEVCGIARKTAFEWRHRVFATVGGYQDRLRRYLFRFPGMKKGNLQSCLNWFVYLFRVRRDEEKWPKTARALRHLLISDAHFRS